MEITNEYKTKQRNTILDIIKNHDFEGLTTEDILLIIKKEKLDVSRATLYRYLDKLVASNEVRKFYNAELNRYEYQYAHRSENCNHHIHLKCKSCGKLIHLDCKDTKLFVEHIEKEHGFAIDNLSSVLYGLCEECRRK